MWTREFIGGGGIMIYSRIKNMVIENGFELELELERQVCRLIGGLMFQWYWV